MEENQINKETTNADTDTGGQPKEMSPIERANVAAERLEKANEVRETQIRREEVIAADKMLDGDSEAGQEPEKPKVLNDKEYTEAFLTGEIDPLK